MSASTRIRVVSMLQNGLAKEGITVSKKSVEAISHYRLGG